MFVGPTYTFYKYNKLWGSYAKCRDYDTVKIFTHNTFQGHYNKFLV